MGVGVLGALLRFRSVLLLGCIVFCFPLFGKHYVARDEKLHTDYLDFSSTFSDMETLEIHAQRKKRIHFDVSGSFPNLETIHYQGSFGYLRANITGDYPAMHAMAFTCSSCRMELDFQGRWYKDACIRIANEGEPIVLTLPSDVGVIVHTDISMKGKIVIEHDLQKQGFGLWKKTYRNALVGHSPITLVFEVRSGAGGMIILR